MKVRIIATIGPATKNKKLLKKLVKTGVDIGRINMKYSSIKEAIKISKNLSKSNCKILIDIKDNKRLQLLKQINFDYLALSFTETAEDIKEIRRFFFPRKIFIIAKIETKKGVRNIDYIINESDGIMVARGDLGNHVPLEELPLFQKMIIRKCNKKRKFVITATEMLLSMVNSKIPERAEVSDVANAVLDGSNALMLSEETAIGRHPLEAVSIMHKIIAETIKDRKLFK
jgi:pyruvate kinase